MSRIGNKPIPIPSGVDVNISGNKISVKGPLGADSIELLDGIVAVKEGESIVLKAERDEKSVNSYHGLFRSLVNNMVIGTSTGFERELEIIGVGYRATQQGTDIQFQLGYSHNILFNAPAGITLQVVEPTKIKVKGCNKQQVGQIAANIRELRPPEPYKGKGIRYKDEIVRKKAGKTGK